MLGGVGPFGITPGGSCGTLIADATKQLSAYTPP
jgi:hypothetical protein